MVTPRMAYAGLAVAGGVAGYVTDRQLADSPWRQAQRTSRYELPVRYEDRFLRSYVYEDSQEYRDRNEVPGKGASRALLLATSLGAVGVWTGAGLLTLAVPSDRIARRFAPIVALRGVAALGAGAFVGALASRSIYG